MKRAAKIFYRKLVNYFNYNSFKSLGIPRSFYKELLNPVNSTSSILFNKPIEFSSKKWYKHGLEEIFFDQTYMFQSSKKSPDIIDCGANIGMSIIYFRRLFPESRIVGFEPDKFVFNQLQKNLSHYNFSQVELVEKAVWIRNEKLQFSSEGSVGGSIQSRTEFKTIEVESMRLRDYLSQEVDFLKIDIEGAELEVLRDCSDKLSNVKNIFVEYHSNYNEPQMLDEILSILKKTGFRFYIKEAWVNLKHPFVDRKSSWFDLQLNVSGYRV